MLYATQTKMMLWFLDQSDKWLVMVAEPGISAEAVRRRSEYARECINDAKRILLDAVVKNIETEPMPAAENAVCEVDTDAGIITSCELAGD